MPIQTPRISTYWLVTDLGDLNPFETIPDVDHFEDYTAEDFHNYFLAFHRDLPVFNDYVRLQAQLLSVWRSKMPEWVAKWASIPQYSPTNPPTQTKTETHSGTDNSNNSGGATDKENTYDNATLRDIRKTETSGSGSITHGHVITTNRNEWITSREKTYLDYRKLAEYNIFDIIVDDVLQAISCNIYTRGVLSND